MIISSPVKQQFFISGWTTEVRAAAAKNEQTAHIYENLQHVKFFFAKLLNSVRMDEWVSMSFSCNYF